MIVDSSAIIAICFREKGFEELLDKLAASRSAAVGTPTLVETGIVLSARLERDARGLLERFAQEFGLQAVVFGERHWRAAHEAWLRFGKGRHRARLNLGDCMSYATAKVAARPLLCTGRDFVHTDIELA